MSGVQEGSGKEEGTWTPHFLPFYKFLWSYLPRILLLFISCQQRICGQRGGAWEESVLDPLRNRPWQFKKMKEGKINTTN